jgi:hypothetical protein
MIGQPLKVPPSFLLVAVVCRLTQPGWGWHWPACKWKQIPRVCWADKKKKTKKNKKQENKTKQQQQKKKQWIASLPPSHRWGWWWGGSSSLAESIDESFAWPFARQEYTIPLQKLFTVFCFSFPPFHPLTPPPISWQCLMWPRLPLNLLHSQGWSWTSAPPAFTSQVRDYRHRAVYLVYAVLGLNSGFRVC